ncbi:T9SS-dependent choice-of-anchor J family protein [Nonlabens xiamenensis]|uniref:T9SS-dependent choice-of-anchor J family protein n=1 Tax=Nonlabens xiamenensis TaxID=2341043 RepID=UPI000F60FD7C|nr:choice-of-anchor J domain-containing protein [Nonlabens xiamenensis]
MKKITLLIMLLATALAHAQLPEDFNGAAFPPAGWLIADGANGLGTTEQWQQDGTSPEFFALSLWEAVATGQSAEDWLVTPLVSITSTENLLQFLSTDLNQGEFGSVLSIRVSTTSQSNQASFTEVASFTEDDLGNDQNAAFAQFTVNLNAYLNQSVYIAFVHVQNDGDGIVVDNVELVEAAAGPPGPANTPTPADMATGVVVDITDGADANTLPDNAVTFAWSADTSLGSVPPSEFEFLLGDSPTTLASLGVVPATTTSVPVQGFQYNTTYYWQIIPRNNAGDATNNPVWSFTTEAGNVSAPGVATSPVPADMATGVLLRGDDLNMDGNPDNAVDFSWGAPVTGDPVESYIFNLGTTSAVDLFVSNRGNATTLRLSGLQPSTTYFWRLDTSNVGGTTTGQVWEFTTDSTAGIDDEKTKLFTISPNPTSDFLNITSGLQIDQLEIYNGLGQQVKSFKQFTDNVDVQDLPQGTYFVRAQSGELTQTIKFIKK